MEKLIITCCTNDPASWGGCDGLTMPVTAREIAESACAACGAGAAVVHVNEPLVRSGEDSMGYNVAAWLKVARLIRQESNVIFQHGLAGLPYFNVKHRIPAVPDQLRQRTFDLGVEKPDMISALLTQQDNCFGPGYQFMPTRDEIERFMLLCRQHAVKPAFEVWHIGAYYELRWLANRGLVEPPYWLTLYLGATSGVGSPPTTEELLNRIKDIPDHALWQVSIYCGVKGTAGTRRQLELFTQAITLGGHIRVGMEDNPYYRDGVPAQSNAQLVERVVRIARDLGREVATPDEARRILGLPGV